MNLESDNHKKLEIAIDCSEDLIRQESLNDLDVVAQDLI
jgi:hypothetical protein